MTLLALAACLALATTDEPAAVKPLPPAPMTTPTPTDTSACINEAVVNAPPSELWKVFTTPEGFKNLGVAKAEIDLRIGGLMRSHYDPKGVLGDEGTITNQIIAYEPLRMIAFRIHTPPKGFPFKEAWKSTWSVATFTDLGNGRTHVRLTGLGYDASDESQKMREFFQNGNGYVMKLLQSKFDSAAAAPAGSAHAAPGAGGADNPTHAAPGAGGADILSARSENLGPIEVETLIAAPRATVYSWYATSPGWKAALGLDSRIEPRIGGPFEVYFGHDAPAGQRGSEGCTVLAFIPGEMFSHTWNAPPTIPHCRDGGLHTWVVVRFDEVGPALTRVRLTHQGFSENAAKETDQAFAADWVKTRAYFTNAWPRVLDALKAHAAK